MNILFLLYILLAYLLLGFLRFIADYRKPFYNQPGYIKGIIYKDLFNAIIGLPIFIYFLIIDAMNIFDDYGVYAQWKKRNNRRELMATVDNKTSKVAQWIEMQYQKYLVKNPSLMQALSFEEIRVITYFITWAKVNKSGDRVPELLGKPMLEWIAPYQNDATLFELGCHLYFIIDLWHVKHGYKPLRSFVVRYLIRDFIEIFEDSLGIRHADEIFLNRWAYYSGLINRNNLTVPTEEIFFTLSNLIGSTRNNTPPKKHDIGRMPLSGGDAIDHVFRERDILDFLISAIPISLKFIKRFYEDYPDSKRNKLYAADGVYPSKEFLMDDLYTDISTYKRKNPNE